MHSEILKLLIKRIIDLKNNSIKTINETHKLQLINDTQHCIDRIIDIKKEQLIYYN
jgi:hypothetical protein